MFTEKNSKSPFICFEIIARNIFERRKETCSLAGFFLFDLILYAYAYSLSLSYDRKVITIISFAVSPSYIEFTFFQLYTMFLQIDNRKLIVFICVSLHFFLSHVLLSNHTIYNLKLNVRFVVSEPVPRTRDIYLTRCRRQHRRNTRSLFSHVAV